MFERIFEKILVPLDGSASGERVLPYLVRLCALRPCKIVVARIVDLDAAGAGPDQREALVQFAQLYLNQIEAHLTGQGLRVASRVRSGGVTEGLLEIAHEERATLLAMSTHGRLMPDAPSFGDVAEQIIRKSPLPLLVVSPFVQLRIERVPHVMDRGITRILVTTDGSETADKVTPLASEVAETMGAEVVLLQVAAPARSGRGEAEARVHAEDHLDRLSRYFEERRIPTETLVEEGEPGGTILEVARRRGVDLIAMNTHGARHSHTAVGDVTEAVLKRAAVPLLLPASAL